MTYFQSWIDETLRWNPDEYDGCDTVRLSKDYFWVPDIILWNK